MAKLYFYYSAMNAGKSTTLLQSSYNYLERGMNTLLFMAAIDTRYAEGRIHSRIGLEAEAVPFNRELNLFDFVQLHLPKLAHLDCVLVDEAQFLTRQQVEQLTQITDELNIPVLTYGLRTDFRGEPFEGSRYLLAWAEEISEIKAICGCGRKATMNIRIDEQGHRVLEGAQVEIGGNERYTSLCRKCFKAGHVVKRR